MLAGALLSFVGCASSRITLYSGVGKTSSDGTRLPDGRGIAKS